MRNPLQMGEPKTYRFKGCRSVHIGHYVLLWVVVAKRLIVVRFAHHDHAYG